MKLYKYLISALLLGSMVGFGSCKNEENDIFDASAAQRLDEYKKQYSADLTAEGGKWLMEYFANEEERGYAFVMTFNSDGSVKVSGQNVWFDNAYRSDVSMWQIIADNGPVLSFNTYNTVLHEFSRPENLLGPEAPINPDSDKDIDELGEGHAGDYEFVIIGLSEDGKTMHLTGKKRLYDIYMYRLDPDVDEVALLAKYHDAAYSTFSSRFPNYFITDVNTGERFEVSGGPKGMFDAWPVDGDPVVQTSKINGMITPDGLRFRTPFVIERADGNDSIVVDKFVKQADGKFLCTYNDQNLVMDCIGLGNIFSMKEYVWHIDNAKSGGKFAEYFDEISKKCRSSLRITFKGFDFLYSMKEKRYVLNFKRSGSNAEYYFFGNETVVDDGDAVKVEYSTTDIDQNAQMLMQKVPVVADFVSYLNSCDFNFVVSSRFAPSVIKMEDKTDPANFLYVTLN